MANGTILAASILLVTACSSDSMHSDSGRLSAAVVDERAENARHEQACYAAQSMSGVMDELGRHERAMTGMMGEMTGGMDEMSQCSAPDSNRVVIGIAKMRSEMGDHRLHLQGALDLMMAYDECWRHASSIESNLRWMSVDLQEMSCMTNGH